MEDKNNKIILVIAAIFLLGLFIFLSISTISALSKYNYVRINNLSDEINNISNELNKTYLQDIRFPAIDLTTNNVNDPDKSTFKGFQTWFFSPTKYAELESLFQYPHIENGFPTYVVRPHFHWSLINNVSNNQCIVWGVQYNCANINGFFNRTTTIKKRFCISGNVAYKHIFSEMDNITVLNRENSRQCIFRIFRDATNITDNLTQSVALIEFDIHYYYKKYGQIIS